jgi:hypothetical protein
LRAQRIAPSFSVICCRLPAGLSRESEAIYKKLFIICIAVLLYLLFDDWQHRPIAHPGGVLVSNSPVQVDIPSAVFELDNYQVTRKARFEVRARVLGTEPYYLSRESDLSPLDLALGWGVMTDQNLLDQLEIKQSSRWYRWRYDQSIPVTNQQIIANSSNMHMIPAQGSVERALKKLRPGDIVTLKGYLVDVDHESGWRWRTSMSRTDTGAGACEIVYVEQVTIES